MSIQLREEGKDRGQGLVEYALILVLVSVVSIVILIVFRSQIRNIYCRAVERLNQEADTPDNCTVITPDTIVITLAEHDPDDGEINIRATSNGGYNPDSELTVAVNEISRKMTHRGHEDFYRVRIKTDVSGCPCMVSVTSSLGGSAQQLTVPD